MTNAEACAIIDPLLSDWMLKNGCDLPGVELRLYTDWYSKDAPIERFVALEACRDPHRAMVEIYVDDLEQMNAALFDFFAQTVVRAVQRQAS